MRVRAIFWLGWHSGLSVFGKLVSWKSGTLAFCVLVIAAQSQAQELQPLFVDVTYETDALQGCPSVAEFRAIMSQQLGYDPYSPGSALGVEVRIRSSEAGLEGSIDWSNTDANKAGERHFTSRSNDCREMVTTVGFVLAVQIQLLATERTNALAPPKDGSGTESDGEPPTLPSQRVPSVTLAINRFDVRPASVSSTSWSATVGLGPSIGFGLAPSSIAQGRLFVALQTAWFQLESGAEASLPSTKRQPYGGGFQHELFLGTLAACGWHRAIAACGVGKLGKIQVRGTGVDRPVSSSGFVAQVGPRLAYAFELGNHLLLLGHVEGTYLLTPWVVDLNRLNVWTMPHFSGVAGIDLVARFQ